MPITIAETTSIYCRYQSQTEPQPCYLYVNLRRATMRCDYNPEIGGAVTWDQWHGHIRAYRIPAGYTALSQMALMRRVLTLAERVLAGYESRWDGSNHVAALTDDAQAADDAINSICETEYETASEGDVESHWDAADWYVDGRRATLRDLGITESSTAEEIERIAAVEEERARERGHHVHGVASYLLRARDSVTAAEDD